MNEQIVFDTNAWLDLYTINPIALNEIINGFKGNSKNFWVVNQVYWEFYNHYIQHNLVPCTIKKMLKK